MNIRPNLVTFTVADYCGAYGRREVLVDRKYQRHANVWPERAQSYLIETILRGFPVPKLALHQQTDIKSRQTLKYVVDGQQRTHAIVDFFFGNLTLSKSLEIEEARGKKLDEISEELQQAFLSYPLQFDQFEAVDEGVVREYYRRINSFTSPLNPEERRHANFQGNMKWFILKLAERHTETLFSLRTMSEREIVRMADHKLFAEVVHALLNGVRTTNSTMLDSMYRKYNNDDIPEEQHLLKAIDSAFSRVVGWRELCTTNIVQRTHVFYSLILAVISVEHNWHTLLQDQDSTGTIQPHSENNLLAISDALSSESEDNWFRPLVMASSEKTNTKDQRETRMRWLAAALIESKW